jgi:hypothetical protein
MTTTQFGPEPTTGSEPGLFSRFLGIILSPRETFGLVVSRPQWFGMLALTTLVTAAAVALFLSTEVGGQAWLDQAVSQAEAWGGHVSDEQYRGMERMLPYVGLMGGLQFLVMVPLFTVVIAGILYAVFTAALGGTATFRQVFAVVAHGGAITVVQQLFVTPLNYARESMSSATNLSVFFPMLDEGSFLARLLGTLDLFLIWWTVVLAIGLAVLYRRRTRPIAIGLFAVYGAIAVAIATVMTLRGGS